jgi:ankyrin repeat protein
MKELIQDQRFFNKIVDLIDERDMDHLFSFGDKISIVRDDEGKDILAYYEGYNDEKTIHFLVGIHSDEIQIFSSAERLCRAALFAMHKEKISQLINQGYDVSNILNQIEPGFNLLMDAVGENDAERVKYYLAIGAKVDQLAFTSQPLMLAVLWKHIECIEVLCAHGADINLPAGDNSFYKEGYGFISPWELAKEMKHQQIIDILKQYG